MVIGGNGPSGNQVNWTYYYNHENILKNGYGKGEWLEGPQMLQERGWHAVGVVIDQGTLKNIIIVTGGFNGIFLDSTEILLENQWIQGENIKH